MAVRVSYAKVGYVCVGDEPTRAYERAGPQSFRALQLRRRVLLITYDKSLLLDIGPVLPAGPLLMF